MTKRNVVIDVGVGSLTVLAALGLGGCGKKTTAASSNASAAIHIGAVLTISGSLASASALEQDAIEMAANEINAAGGVLGRQMVIDVVDDGAVDSQSLADVQQLAAAGTTIDIGPTYSSGLLTTAAWAIPNNVSLLTYSATSPAISSLNSGGLVNRTCPSDAFQGAVAANLVYAAPYATRKASIIALADAYGTGLSGAFTTQFTKLGGTVISTQTYPELTDSQAATYDFSTIATKALAGNPDLLYLITYETDGAQLTKALKAGFDAMATKPLVLGCDGNDTDGFLANADPDVVKNMIGTQPSPDPTNPDYIAFNQRFQAAYGTQGDLYSPLAYDATYLYALAITAAGKTDGKDVGPQVITVSQGTTKVKPTAYAAAIADIKAGQSVGYVGVSGLSGLDSNGDPTSGTYEIWQNQNNTATQIKLVPYP